MSNAVSRGHGRGKPSHGYFPGQHDEQQQQQQQQHPMTQQQFVMPYVPQGPFFSNLRQMPVNQMPQQAYGNPQYAQPFQPQQFYSQQQVHQPPPQPHPQNHPGAPHQGYNNYTRVYEPYNAQFNQHYNNPAPTFHHDMVNFSQQNQPPSQNTELKQRKRVVLEIVDPNTKKTIELPPRSTPAPVPPVVAAQPAPSAADVEEKKKALSQEMLSKVKQELKDDDEHAKSPVPHTATAPVVPLPLPTNFSRPPPALGQQLPMETPLFVPPQEQTSQPQVYQPTELSQQPTTPPAAKIESQESLIPESNLTPVSSPSVAEQSAKPSPATEVESPVSAASAVSTASVVSEAIVESPAAAAATTTPVLQKEESKEETDDDKFDENDSQCDETSPSPDAIETSAEKTPEEIANDKAAKEAAEVEKRKKRVEVLSQQIAELLDIKDADVEIGSYGRVFMMAVREYEGLIKRTPCPLSPAQLSEFGLDIKSMRPADNKKPNFTPNWMPNSKGSRPSHSYRGRTTTDGTGRGAQPRDRANHKRPPTVRASIERVQRVTLPSSKDAWKPERQKAGENITEDEAKIKEVCKKVRALMNKVTPTSQGPLTKEFISYDVSSNDSQLTQVVGIVFDKAVEEPKFCSLYAEICRAQADHEIKLHDGKSAFRNKVLTRTQMTFQDRSEFDEERMAVIEKEEDPVKRELLKVEERQKFRRRKFGVMTFIGHLYRNHLLSTKIVQACTFELFNSILPKKIKDKEQELRKEDIDEESVHCALQLIETVGAMVDRSKESTTVFLDQWFQKLEAAKPYCSNKIRFMIMNLIELRNNKWVPRKTAESGPKKIDEIHNDIRQEKIENEKARENYDRDRDRRHGGGGGGGGIRSNTNSVRKPLPTSRNSIERNKTFQNPEQKRSAAAATTKLTSSSVPPKNISLSSMGDSSLGRSKKDWNQGASGGGNTPSEASKNAWGRTEQRKRSTVDDRQSALAAARDIGSGNLNLAARRSASQTSIPEKVEEELTDEQREQREKLMNTINSDIKELVAGDLSQKEMSESFADYVNKDKYAKPTLSGVYEMAVRSVSEKAMKEKERIALAHSIRLSLTGKDEKQAFIDGCVKFCKYAVDIEMHQDLPFVWTHTAHLLMNTMHVPPSVIGEEKVELLSLNDMGPVFLAAKLEGSKKFGLFLHVLKELVEAELTESGSNDAQGVSWEFQELKFRAEMEKDGLKEELAGVKLNSGRSLDKLLHP